MNMLRRTFVSLLAAPLGLANPDNDGMLLIDGKRQFVLVLYDSPQGSRRVGRGAASNEPHRAANVDRRAAERCFDFSLSVEGGVICAYAA